MGGIDVLLSNRVQKFKKTQFIFCFYFKRIGLILVRSFFVQFGELNNLAPYLSIFSNQLECACYNFLSSKLIYYGVLPCCVILGHYSRLLSFVINSLFFASMCVLSPKQETNCCFFTHKKH